MPLPSPGLSTVNTCLVRDGAWELSILFNIKILAGMISNTSSTGNYSRSEFKSSIEMSCSKNSISEHSYTFSGYYIIPWLLFWYVLSIL